MWLLPGLLGSLGPLQRNLETKSNRPWLSDEMEEEAVEAASGEATVSAELGSNADNKDRPPSRFLFVGNGLYCGDGGAELQRVWDLHAWKPLGGCDGRFVQRGALLAKLSLSELCIKWAIVSRSKFLRCCEADDQGNDAVECVRFVGGGGLLTYIKTDGLTFVHTLNTESGLARKLIAMRGGVHGHLVRALGSSSPAAPLFCSLCALLSRIEEPERTPVAPAIAVAMRCALARASTRVSSTAASASASGGGSASIVAMECGECDQAEAPPRRPPKRSIDFLLEGTSVRTNRHLARFAAAPFLPFLLANPCFTSLLSRTSKQLKKEVIEAYVLIEALERGVALPSRHAAGQPAEPAEEPVEPVEPADQPPPAAVVDLCCGKGYLSLLLALECPTLPIIAVDNNAKIDLEHISAIPNLTFLQADVMAASFGAALATALASALASARDSAAGVAGGGAGCADALSAGLQPTRSSCIALGMHLCGPLSPRAIELFAGCDALSSLVLVPCCLDRRTDGPLKMQARELGVDPYECKVRQLTGLLEAAPATVALIRGVGMRTKDGTEGGAACKDAILLGRKSARVVEVG